MRPPPRLGAEAIVVDSERHSRLHAAIGTVTGELLRCAPVPVVVVPLTAALAGSAAGPARARAPRRR